MKLRHVFCRACLIYGTFIALLEEFVHHTFFESLPKNWPEIFDESHAKVCKSCLEKIVGIVCGNNDNPGYYPQSKTEYNRILSSSTISGQTKRSISAQCLETIALRCN